MRVLAQQFVDSTGAMVQVHSVKQHEHRGCPNEKSSFGCLSASKHGSFLQIKAFKDCCSWGSSVHGGSNGVTAPRIPALLGKDWVCKP